VNSELGKLLPVKRRISQNVVFEKTQQVLKRQRSLLGRFDRAAGYSPDAIREAIDGVN
jgi:hypothetical protein